MSMIEFGLGKVNQYAGFYLLLLWNSAWSGFLRYKDVVISQPGFKQASH